MSLTKLENLINPQIMADMISAKLPMKIVVTPFARIDRTLEGKAGDTITVPKYAYIGDAEDVAEGVEATTAQLTATSVPVTVKKAMKAVELTDEALLSGYGDPRTEAVNQLTKAIASKIDADAFDAISGTDVQLKYDGSASQIAYDGICDAVDVFDEERNSNKVIFVNPKQVTKIRKDMVNFLPVEKLAQTVIDGEIGMIGGCHVVPTRKVVKTSDTGLYACPIVKLDADEESEDTSPALTIYIKRSVNLETERETLKRCTIISVDQFYTASLTNTSKVVLATFKA